MDGAHDDGRRVACDGSMLLVLRCTIPARYVPQTDCCCSAAAGIRWRATVWRPRASCVSGPPSGVLRRVRCVDVRLGRAAPHSSNATNQHSCKGILCSVTPFVVCRCLTVMFVCAGLSSESAGQVQRYRPRGFRAGCVGCASHPVGCYGVAVVQATSVGGGAPFAWWCVPQLPNTMALVLTAAHASGLSSPTGRARPAWDVG